MTSTVPRGFYVAGIWAETAGVRQIVCPADLSPVGAVAECTPDDAAAAVLAARSAFDRGPWPTGSTRERGDLLVRTADLLERDRLVYAKAEALDTGMPLADARDDLDEAIACFRSSGALSTDPSPAQGPGSTLDEPVGVCALITPWSHPLLQVARYVVPALLAGNTFVLKPSELTPSTAILLMDTLTEAGLPAGVGNLVTGSGPEVGTLLSTHPAVDLVSFAGGAKTGRAIMTAAAATLKRVHLQLRGKETHLVFADAERKASLDALLDAAFLHPGPAGVRLLVQDRIAANFVPELVTRAEQVRMGGPFDEGAQSGALISIAHRDRVHGSVGAAVAEGARLRCGGAVPTAPGLAAGSFYPPTVLDGCTSAMACVRQESRGPVLTVQTFADEAAAVALANEPRSRPTMALWTGDADQAERVAGALLASTVLINHDASARLATRQPLGPRDLTQYRETKHVWRRRAAAPPDGTRS
jgi:betaine-aldehyde dehydrogenase